LHDQRAATASRCRCAVSELIETLIDRHEIRTPPKDRGETAARSNRFGSAQRFPTAPRRTGAV
ncbi:MAG: hypothetical protein M3N49_15980, partial [Candidatus Eremiobacteraeota bacterium]|nr:hypothetical protein [Candidatus Eremiobacteraeota bacterium]